MRFFFLCSVAVTAGFFLISHSVFAETTSSADGSATSVTATIAESVTSTEPVIFQMGDGRFYAPASGRMAASREELLSYLSGAAGIVPASTHETVSSTQPIILSVATDFPLKQAIVRAKALLQEEINQEIAINPKKKILSVDNGSRDMRVALWDPATDQLLTIDIRKKGSVVAMKSAGPKIIARNSNGINTSLAVNDGSGKIVVAVRYPIYAEKILNKKKKQYTVTDVVYTPYSMEIATPEMIAYGRSVLDRYMDDVYQELRVQGVASWAFPDQLLTNVIDPGLAKTIAVIEHTDQSALTKDTDGTVNMFFVNLAANPETAFAYAKSSASALGLVQFIPSTYKTMVIKHPELHLDPNFESGMRDMPNAIKAEVAYLDSILHDLPASVRATYVQDEGRERVQEYMTAAYNGGTARVKKAIAVWDDIWTGDLQANTNTLQKKHNTLVANVKTWKKQLTKAVKATEKTALKKKIATAQAEDKDVASRLAILKSSTLRKETIGYIAKYRKVIDVIEGKTVTLAFNE